MVYLSKPFRSAFRRERELSEPPELSAICSPDSDANSTPTPLHAGEREKIKRARVDELREGDFDKIRTVANGSLSVSRQVGR